MKVSRKEPIGKSCVGSNQVALKSSSQAVPRDSFSHFSTSGFTNGL